MNEIGEYLEKKQRMEIIQNVIKLDKKSSEEWNLDGVTYFENGINGPKSIKYFDSNVFGNSSFLSNVLNKESVQLPDNLRIQLHKISDKLNVVNEIQQDVEQLLHKLYVTNAQKEINISMSNDNEFLIYINSKGTFKNILINEDGDIELLIIPSNKSESYNKTFYKEDGLNLSTVVSTFNEMR